MNLRGLASVFWFLCVVGCASNGEREPESSLSDQVRLVDEAELRGLTFSHVSGADNKYYMPEIMGGGVALVDIDNDGDLDSYFVQSGNLLNQQPDHKNAMFTNDGSGYFIEHNAGDASRNLGYGMGVAVADYDNDGDTDLYVTNLGANALLENNGHGRFTNVATTSGVDIESWGTASTFMDFDNDGWLDLFVVNYIDWSHGMEIECFHPRLGTREYCAPLEYQKPAQDRLFRNNGDGTFTDVTLYAGMLGVRGTGLGVVNVDVNDDGLVDLFVSNDSMPNHLWINQGEMKFVESAFEWGCAVDEHGQSKAGMGVTYEDFDSDGDFDLLVVNLVGQTDTLFAHQGSHYYDATTQFGLADLTRRFTRFGLVAADFNNDGLLDFMEVNGSIIRSPEPVTSDPYAEPNEIYLGTDARSFGRVTLDETIQTSRGAALGDVDGDGRVDVLVGNRDAEPTLLMNRSTNAGNWAKIRVLNSSSSDYLGAVITGRVGDREVKRRVRVDGSYLSSSDPTVIVGLGQDIEIRDVRVQGIHGEERAVGVILSQQSELVELK